MKQVTLFNGEDLLHVDLKYFFQDPNIEKLKPEQVVELYQTSAIYISVMDRMSAESKGDSVVDPDIQAQSKHGLTILEGMVKDLYGDESANLIFKLTDKLIKSEGS